MPTFVFSISVLLLNRRKLGGGTNKFKDKKKCIKSFSPVSFEMICLLVLHFNQLMNHNELYVFVLQEKLYFFCNVVVGFSDIFQTGELYNCVSFYLDF